MAETTEIRGGIEWYGADQQEGRCARCGSSVEWLRCANRFCDHGEVEHEPWDCCDDEPYWTRCDWCGGTGGSWHCISSPEWCEAHPVAGREDVKSTAVKSEVWNERE